MRTKVIALLLTVFLIVNTSSALAARTGSAPNTSSRSGSFSTSPGSPSKSSPSSSSSSTFSGGTSGKTSPSNSTSPSGSSNSTSSGFSGGASNKSTVPSASSSTDATKNGSTYSTGYQRPSANVTDGSRVDPYSGRNYYGGSAYYNTVPNGYRASSFWPTVGAFAAGTFLGSMIHPWGGYYPSYGGGYVHQPFSFMSLLLDLIVMAFIIWLAVFIIRRIFVRR